MSEIAIFSFGSVLFVFTAWATFAFGLRRVHELQLRDLDDSDLVTGVRSERLTEIHVTRDASEERLNRTDKGQ